MVAFTVMPDAVTVPTDDCALLGVEKPLQPKPELEKIVEPPRPVEAMPEPKPDVPVLPKPEPPKITRQPAQPKPEAAKPPKPASESKAEPAATPEVRGSERGAAAGLALGASVAGLDNPDFTYGYYVDQMLSMIQANWVRPMVGSGVEVTIYYRIARDGRITEARIANSSGINSFDLAALRAVQATNPLPPLPRAFRDSWLGVHLIFR